MGRHNQKAGRGRKGANSSKSKPKHISTKPSRPKHQKLDIKFDPEARRTYLTTLSSKKQDRRAFGLAMQKVKDRKAKIVQKREEKAAMMSQIEEAEKMKKRELFDDYDSHDEEEEEERKGKEGNNSARDDDIKVETFQDESTQTQFGGQVIVTTSYGLPSDDSDNDDIDDRAKKSIDSDQRYAGSVEKYMTKLKSNMPSKKAKFTNMAKNARGGKKGKHGAEKMIGGSASDLKLAQKTLSRVQGNNSRRGGSVDDRRGGKKGKKGKGRR